MKASEGQLSRSSFLRQGLEVLAVHGPRALTAARLSRELGVTTGSFYWHFKTIDHYRSELKSFWRDEIVVGIMVDARERAEASDRLLEEVGRLIAERRSDRFDSAMRAWAESDAEARMVVEAADALRRDLIAGALKSAGASETDARDRTNLLGAAWRGSRDLDTSYRLKLVGLITQNGDG